MADSTRSQSRPDRGDGRPRLRTAWRVRRRYKLAQRLATLVCGLIAIAAVAAVIAAFPDPRKALAPGFVAPAAALVVGALALPWLAVGQMWRRAWLKNRDEWGEGALY